MKQLLPLLLLAGTMQAQAQNCEDLGRFYIGANFKYGQLYDRMNVTPAPAVYPNTVNYSRSHIQLEKGRAIGAEAQLGYFFSPNRKWGVGVGVVYLKGESAMRIDSTHFEYRSVDFNNDVFRQVITTTSPISETYDITNISIPVVMKFRTPISDRFLFNLDGGIVYNVKMETEYSGSAAYNYEAIYRFDQLSDGSYAAVYDNSPAPDPKDWLITVHEYNQDKTDGNVQSYFETLAGQGYNVGLNKAGARSGKIEHDGGTIGVLLQPSFSYRVTSVVSLNLGGYLMYQNFKNTESHISRMTDDVGEYNTLLNNVPRRRQYNYGLNAGISLCF